MIKAKTYIAASVALFFNSALYAGTCDINFTRTACPGQEKVSYKKCDGDQSCTESESAASIAECKTLAMAACENKRFEITKSKVITASFDGKAVKSDAGDEDFCKSYPKRAAEFNKCSK